MSTICTWNQLPSLWSLGLTVLGSLCAFIWLQCIGGFKVHRALGQCVFRPFSGSWWKEPKTPPPSDHQCLCCVVSSDKYVHCSAFSEYIGHDEWNISLLDINTQYLPSFSESTPKQSKISFYIFCFEFGQLFGLILPTLFLNSEFQVKWNYVFKETKTIYWD